MQAAPTIASAASRSGTDAGARCAHLIFGNVLGADIVAELLQRVARREADFKPAVIRNRRSGERRVDPRQRDCLFLGDLGPFKPMIDSFIRGSIPKMLAGLQLGEAAVEPREFEICAYGDGGHFGAHVDTNELTDRGDNGARRGGNGEPSSDGGGAPLEIRQSVGDAVIFNGQELSHFRPPFTAGTQSTSLLLHYVDHDFTGVMF
jgi:hypothetical protein